MDRENCRKVIRQLKTEGPRFFLDNVSLVPITFDYRTVLPECVELLSRWRIENPSLSPARFPVSNSRTEKWLNNSILDNDERVLFMIQNSAGVCIGHIGLSGINYDASSVQIDSVMRGVKNDCPGMMGNVIAFLKNWCREALGARMVELVVLDDNEKAIRLYHRCNFVEDRVIPLQKIEENDEVRWIENDSLANPERRFIHMISNL